MANYIYNQYRNKSKFLAWSEITRSFADQVIDAAESVRDSYDIDNNSGEQLVVIGDIVQRDKIFTTEIGLATAQCSIDMSAMCGDISGTQFSTLTMDDSSSLSDDYFKLMIKSKISKNNGSCTYDEILDAVNLMAPSMLANNIVDNEDMSFGIEYVGTVSDTVLQILVAEDLVPTPQGVSFTGFTDAG